METSTASDTLPRTDAGGASRHAIRALLSLLALLAATPLVAADRPAGDRGRGWHTVRPGDTLEHLAARYMGNHEHWKDLWQVNPQLTNPHLLRPGERLAILLPPGLPEDSAQLEALGRRVDSKPNPIPWDRAQVGDLLLERDGLRTHERASAGVRFPDGTLLRLAESSLVFLRALPAPYAAASKLAEVGQPEASVEIHQGQADLAAIRPTTGAVEREIEILVKQVRARARGGETPLSGRARLATSTAQLMIYDGSADVATGNEQLALSSGMGTSVPDRGNATVERLLAAPTPTAPGPTTSDRSAPSFAWSAVDGAATYTLDICTDRDCGATVHEARAIAATSWQPEAPLTPGSYVWRVRAVAASGLDGYPSAWRELTVAGAAADSTGPAIAITLPETPWTVAEVACFDAEALSVEVSIHDADCGVASEELVLDGVAVTREQLAAGHVPGGSHRLEVAAVDGCGNRTVAPPVDFVADADPPFFLSESRAPAPLELGMMPEPGRDVVRRRLRWQRKDLRWLEWSSAGHLWMPVPTGFDPKPVREYLAESVAADSRPTWADGTASWQLDPQRPWIFFTAPGGSPLRSGPALEAGQTLWVIARDPGCGLSSLTLTSQPAASPGDTARLVIEAVDHFARPARLEWTIAPGTTR